MTEVPRIAIIGGGPGGLTLARILHVNGISPVVYEHDQYALARPQGGTLDLRPETGQWAIRLACLESEFRAVARYQDQATSIRDSSGTLLFAEEGTGDDAPEIDRTQLRQILLHALPDGMVRWGQKIECPIALADGTFKVVANDGTAEIFDLVVGADGAWSRVRPLVCDAVPVYEGVTFAEIGIDDIDVRYPAIAELVGHGTLFALGHSKGLIAQRNSASHVRIYAALRVDEAWGAAFLATADPKRNASTLRAQFAGWAPQLLELLDAAGDNIVVRPLYALPVGIRWENRPGITLIGDAAHLMSPFAGEGVNMAMADAADLAMRLSDAPSWRHAVATYEKMMFERTEHAARQSAEGLRAMISPDGAANAVRMFTYGRDEASAYGGA